jgi:hypothetical protein
MKGFNFVVAMHRGGKYGVSQFLNNFPDNVIVGHPYANSFLFSFKIAGHIVVGFENKGEWPGQVAAHHFENMVGYGLG